MDIRRHGQTHRVASRSNEETAVMPISLMSAASVRPSVLTISPSGGRVRIAGPNGHDVVPIILPVFSVLPTRVLMIFEFIFIIDEIHVIIVASRRPTKRLLRFGKFETVES
jgi:hypothetical protein